MAAPVAILAPDDPAGAPGAVARAGGAPALDGRTLQDALRRAIATRGGSCWWDVDHAGEVVTLDFPDEQPFYARTQIEGLAWCLVWLMAKGTPGDWGLGTGHPKGLD